MRTTIAALVLATGFSAVLATTASAQERFFACSAGYTFQVNQSAARCFRPQQTQTAPLIACSNINTPAGSVGLFEAIDRLSTGRDQCAGQNPVTGAISVDRACPAGYTYRVVRPGRDVCERTVPPDVRAPSVAVNR